jgi:hypothetical protein
MFYDEFHSAILNQAAASLEGFPGSVLSDNIEETGQRKTFGEREQSSL